MHGRGTGDMLDALLAVLPSSDALRPVEVGGPRRVAIVGKPNVGKSSLLNKLALKLKMYQVIQLKVLVNLPSLYCFS